MVLTELFENAESELELLYNQLRRVKSELSKLPLIDERRPVMSNIKKQLEYKIQVLKDKRTPDMINASREKNKQALSRALEQPKTKTISDVMSQAQLQRFSRLDYHGDWENLSQSVLSLAKEHDLHHFNKSEISNNLGITVRTLNKWLQFRPEFDKIKRFYGI